MNPMKPLQMDRKTAAWMFGVKDSQAIRCKHRAHRGEE
jgi:hypothetical protein